MKDHIVLWPLLRCADVSLDVCRHKDGPGKDKGKAGPQRQIKKGQKEKGVLTHAISLTPTRSIYLPINLTPFLN